MKDQNHQSGACLLILLAVLVLKIPTTRVIAAELDPQVSGNCVVCGAHINQVVEDNGVLFCATSFGFWILDVANLRQPRAGAHLKLETSTEIEMVGSNIILGSRQFLRFIDVADLDAPSVFVELPMDVKSIAVADGLLVVCTGDGTLKVFDITDIQSPQLLSSSEMQVIDVELFGGMAFCMRSEIDFQVLDLVDPGNPVVVGSYDDPETRWPEDLAVSDGFVYLANGSRGVEIINVNDVGAPYRVGVYRGPGREPSYNSVCVSGGILLCGDTQLLSGYRPALDVVDASNPANPFMVGRVDTSGGSSPGAIFPSGDKVFFAQSSQGVDVIDVSTPSQPQRIGGFDVAGWSSHMIAADGIAYVLLERGDLLLVDISNSEEPHLISTVFIRDERGGLSDRSGGLDLVGDLLYVAHGHFGLKIVDVSDPFLPYIVGRVDTELAKDVKALGSYAYLADGESGLKVIDVSNPRRPTIVASPNENGAARSVALKDSYLLVAYAGGTYFGNHLEGAGLVTYDLSHPAAPARVATYPTEIHEIEVSGHLGVISQGEFFYSLGTVELVDVTRPTEIHRLTLITNFFESSAIEAGFVETFGHLLFIGARSDDGFAIFDVLDPLNPELVAATHIIPHGSLQMHGSEVCVATPSGNFFVVDPFILANPQIRGVIPTSGFVERVALHKGMAYAVERGFGVRSFDLSSAEFYREVSSVEMDEWINDIEVGGSAVFVSSEENGFTVLDPVSLMTLDSLSELGPASDFAFQEELGYLLAGDSLHVVNIADPANLVLLKSYSELVGTYGFHSLAVGDDAALLTGTWGLQLLDVSDPFEVTRLYLEEPTGWYDGVCHTHPHFSTGEAFFLNRYAFHGICNSQGLVNSLNFDDLENVSFNDVITEQQARAFDFDGSCLYLAGEVEGVAVYQKVGPASGFERVGGAPGFTALDIAVDEESVVVAGGDDGVVVLNKYVDAPTKPVMAVLKSSRTGNIGVAVDVLKGVDATIQKSSDLKEWEDWLLVRMRGEPVVVEDLQGAESGARFYRVLVK